MFRLPAANQGHIGTHIFQAFSGGVFVIPRFIEILKIMILCLRNSFISLIGRSKSKWLKKVYYTIVKMRFIGLIFQFLVQVKEILKSKLACVIFV